MIRPLQHLQAALELYPNTATLVDHFRQQRGTSLPQWPGWCFLPMAAWYAIVCQGNEVERLPPHLAADVGRLAAIGTWRYSQGVYQFDPDTLAALARTPLSGGIPSEVLYRLPEWCVYIETPGRQWLGSPLYGFWAHLEWDANDGHSELRLLIDAEAALMPVPVHLGPWTVTEAFDRAAAESAREASLAGLALIIHPEQVQRLAAEINPLISVLLYLCSEEPEIDNARQPGLSPSRPQPKKTKRGWRLFPPDRPAFWEVGRATGEKLRAAAEPGPQTGRTVRAHLRRGHWHGYWTGPRDGERRFIYRWIPPIVVAGGYSE